MKDKTFTVVFKARAHWWSKPTVIGYRMAKDGRKLWAVIHRDGRVQLATLDLCLRIMQMITAGTFPREGY